MTAPEHDACRSRTEREETALADVSRQRAEQIARCYIDSHERLRRLFGLPAGPGPWAELSDLERAHLTAVLRELIPLIEGPLRAQLDELRFDRDRCRRLLDIAEVQHDKNL